MRKPWYRSKTVWAGIGSVLSGVSGYATGEVSAPSALQMIFTGLIAIFLRAGIGLGKAK
jgi:hypothetical protein